MNKSFLVLQNELLTALTRRSFWISTLGLPLISALVLMVVTLINRNQQSSAAQALQQAFSSSPPASPLPSGYVDESGLIRFLPQSIPPGGWIAYPDEAAAQRALQAGEIAAYYLIPANYLQEGKVTVVRPDYNPLSALQQANTLLWLLKVNLLAGDERLAARVDAPLLLEEVSLAPSPQRDQDNPLTFFLPYAVTLIFYFTILMSASGMLNSITKEKENRTLEVLILATHPRQLLAGKIVGLGLIGLLQTMIWVGSGYAILRLSGRTFSLPASFQLPPSFLVWALIFFLLGYGLYASLMAGVGALVPNLREASQATMLIIFPLIIPLLMINLLITAPNGGLSTALSLIPFTAPVVMMTRLAATHVPVWQPALASLLILLTLFFILRAVASAFRAQVLLSGQPFSLKRLLKALLTGE